MVAQMSKVASSPAIAIVGAGAALANPGAFIPIALKAISQTNPTTAGYAAQWIAFAVVSLLPLADRARHARRRARLGAARPRRAPASGCSGTRGRWRR